MKFYGNIGFSESIETSPDIWTPTIKEYPYYGDVETFGRGRNSGTDINDQITVSNRISIVADPYAREHFFDMVYICWQGAKWKVSNVDVEFPRLILTLGGVFNESEED
jgi:hypothetical protein